MNNEDLLNKIKSLEEELEKTKEHLKKYTAPSYKKIYYENNKEKLLEKMKSNPVPSDKRKEYNRQSYLRRKEKLKKETEGNENI
jgi:predicted RND superfamily exporter protein